MNKLGLSRRNFLKNAGAGAIAIGMGASATGNCKNAIISSSSAISLSNAAAAPNPSGEPYNILFILTDQERYFDAYPKGMYLPGHERLMRNGVTFTNHQICSAVCTPSRSVIMTGQHIQHTRMFDNTNFPWIEDMSTDIPTIGHMLRKLGYYTTYQGKWHLNGKMDESNVQQGELADPKIMEGYGFGDFVGPGDVIGMTRGGYEFDPFTAATAGTWLRRKGVDLNSEGKPWFMCVSLVNPHDVMFYNTDLPGQNVQDAGQLPYPVRREPPHAIYKQKWDTPLSPTRNQPWDDPGRPAAHQEYQRAEQALVGQFPREDARWKRLQDYYFNCILDCDRSVERLLKELEYLGLADNTVIVYTSDHGELCGAHGMNGKGATAFSEQNHVPLIISHPAIPGGARCKAVTSHLDLAPTMIGLTGIDSAKTGHLTRNLKGKDFSQLLKTPEQATIHAIHPAALYCYNMFAYVDADFIAAVIKGKIEGKKSSRKPDLRKRGAIRTVFDGRYKFSRYFSPLQHNRPETMEQINELNDLELYDLVSDSNETHNLAVNRNKYGELIMAMNARLNSLIDEEVGKDVGQMLPEIKGVNWTITRRDI
ncbi:MAG: sulfatase-like hydrolase/transferase [Planctomycetota bacterium]